MPKKLFFFEATVKFLLKLILIAYFPHKLFGIASFSGKQRKYYRTKLKVYAGTSKQSVLDGYIVILNKLYAH